MSKGSVPSRARRTRERELRQLAEAAAKARDRRIRQESKEARRRMQPEHLDPDTISGRAADTMLRAYAKVEPGHQHLERAEQEALRMLAESDLRSMFSVCRGLERAKTALRQVLSDRNMTPLQLTRR